MDWLDDLEAKARAATQEWHVGLELRHQTGHDLEGWRMVGAIHQKTPREDEHLACAGADRDFSAAANPATVLALIERIRKAEEALVLIQMQRENFPEDAAENSVKFASSALAEIRRKP